MATTPSVAAQAPSDMADKSVFSIVVDWPDGIGLSGLDKQIDVLKRLL